MVLMVDLRRELVLYANRRPIWRKRNAKFDAPVVL